MMKISEITSFSIRLEDASGDDSRITSLDLTRIRTDEGITGYGFRRTDEAVLRDRIRPRLIGKDPAAINEWTEAHVLDGTSAVEHALWDVLGKSARMAVHRLFGSSREQMPYYLTCVWPGAADQSHLTPEQQAQDLLHYVQQGHTRFKIRAWRHDPLEDVRVFSLLREAVGSTTHLELMLDRTAHHPGWLWTDAQARSVAKALEAVGGTWLEEPFARENIPAYRQLRESVQLPITGGEFGTTLKDFRDYLVGEAVDIIQPDANGSGGLLACRKVAALAEAFDVPCILHGTMGPNLAAALQVAASIPSCRMMEIALIHPPLTPQEQWQPIDRILKHPGLFHLVNGQIRVPNGPGLGVDIDDDVVESLRS